METTYYSTLGLYSADGKENGNYYGILGLYEDNRLCRGPNTLVKLQDL